MIRPNKPPFNKVRQRIYAYGFFDRSNIVQRQLDSLVAKIKDNAVRRQQNISMGQLLFHPRIDHVSCRRKAYVSSW